ncbi:hypothetical protein RB195_018409 [Necator americanus]|uniref:Protein kinase domain-containing protein n=1 Tax=Necator americanus TaxID=51031 RepID=A0ABR1C9Q5_NECAM
MKSKLIEWILSFVFARRNGRMFRTFDVVHFRTTFRKPPATGGSQRREPVRKPLITLAVGHIRFCGTAYTQVQERGEEIKKGRKKERRICETERIIKAMLIEFDTSSSATQEASRLKKCPSHSHARRSRLYGLVDIVLKRGVRLANWELQHKNVTIGRVLGQGAFGEVRKGTLLRRSGRSVAVAVKTLKSDTELSKAKIKEMMKEARLMRELKHPNVVCIYGVALLEHPLYIILEYVPGGALDAYLRKNKNVIGRDERLLMAMGAAWGLEYLHKSNVLHRDVAARNCLYDNDKIVKISDFGLSRRGTTYTMKTAKKMPIKWMAPESMSSFTFSQKTDVYSYGVLVFEIFSGVEPYEGVSNSMTKRMIIEGQVNQFPEGTPSKLVEFVKGKMWDHNPDTRLDMTQIVDWMEQYTGLELDLPEDRSMAQEIKNGETPEPNKNQALATRPLQHKLSYNKKDSSPHNDYRISLQCNEYY